MNIQFSSPRGCLSLLKLVALLAITAAPAIHGQSSKRTNPKERETTLAMMASELAKFDKATAEIKQLNDSDIQSRREASKKAGKDPDNDNICLYATGILKAETAAWEKTGNAVRYWLDRKELNGAKFPIPIFLDDEYGKAMMVLRTSQLGKKPASLDTAYWTGRIARLRIIARLLGIAVPNPVTKEWIFENAPTRTVL